MRWVDLLSIGFILHITRCLLVWFHCFTVNSILAFLSLHWRISLYTMPNAGILNSMYRLFLINFIYIGYIERFFYRICHSFHAKYFVYESRLKNRKPTSFFFNKWKKIDQAFQLTVGFIFFSLKYIAYIKTNIPVI